jgi:hypothetical protein
MSRAWALVEVPRWGNHTRSARQQKQRDFFSVRIYVFLFSVLRMKLNVPPRQRLAYHGLSVNGGVVSAAGGIEERPAVSAESPALAAAPMTDEGFEVSNMSLSFDCVSHL